MNGPDDYRYQAEARGLKTDDDVMRLVRQMRPVYERLLTSWLPRHHDAAIYEVACGPGVMLRFLRDQGFVNVKGSDSSEYQVTLARASGFPVTLADSLRELKGHADGTWDCLLGIDFLEHLPKERVTPFIAECFRTLKPGGSLILRTPNGDSPLVGRHLFNDISHQWAFTTIALRSLLIHGGFAPPAFADEAAAAIERQRWIKVPFMKASQAALRWLIRSATRETVAFLSPSLFVCAEKPRPTHD